MYDDRLEIVSPGGMYDGRNIQEINIDDLASVRRNPIIADMFSQLDYMERRGSGLRRIKDFFIDESYVEFRSNKHNFFVVMKKQYYNENGKLQRESDKLQRNEQKLQHQEEKLQQNIKANTEALNYLITDAVKNKTLLFIQEIIEEYGTNNAFDRNDITALVDVTPDRSSQIISLMKKNNLIKKAEGRGSKVGETFE